MYRGVIHGVSVVLKNEGPRGLFRGIGAAVCHTSHVFSMAADLSTVTVHISDDS